MEILTKKRKYKIKWDGTQALSNQPTTASLTAAYPQKMSSCQTIGMCTKAGTNLYYNKG